MMGITALTNDIKVLTSQKNKLFIYLYIFMFYKIIIVKPIKQKSYIILLLL